MLPADDAVPDLSKQYGSDRPHYKGGKVDAEGVYQLEFLRGLGKEAGTDFRCQESVHGKVIPFPDKSLSSMPSLSIPSIRGLTAFWDGIVAAVPPMVVASIKGAMVGAAGGGCDDEFMAFVCFSDLLFGTSFQQKRLRNLLSAFRFRIESNRFDFSKSVACNSSRSLVLTRFLVEGSDRKLFPDARRDSKQCNSQS
ncbi:unnamed protein product [Pseudo-nitzschia multistriata]|uniref:Uncharacterized protein n=1 Tax=Pseudo-nitzschia multistriata TaxID=183589 RepID=A0A448YWY8_9STRA|nr:unnamed protein product [Pseudo-nitzschia multistriata]